MRKASTSHHGCNQHRPHRAVAVDEVRDVKVAAKGRFGSQSAGIEWRTGWGAVGNPHRGGRRHENPPLHSVLPQNLPPFHRLLTVTVENAKDLKNVDWIGSSDPFFIVSDGSVADYFQGSSFCRKSDLAQKPPPPARRSKVSTAR